MNARLLIATTGTGIARAAHEEGEWRVEVVNDIGDVRCVALAPQDPEMAFAGTQGDGVLRSDDGGRTWARVGLGGAIVKAVAVSPHDPNVLYVGLKPPGVAISRDGGRTWSKLDGFRRIRGRRFWFSPAEPPGTAYVQAIAVSPADPDILIAGIEFGAVVRSADGGRTWSGHRRHALRDCHTLRFHARDGSRVYQGGVGFRRQAGATSRDAGESWEAPRDGLERGYGWACAADALDADTWYVSAAPGPRRAHGTAGADAHIYRRHGSGPWQRLAGGLPDPLDSMPYALITDPNTAGHVYTGLANGDVWFSSDYGETWEQLPLRLGAVHRDLMAGFAAG